MNLCRLIFTSMIVTWAVVADAGPQPPVKDVHGDPLPPGAVVRLGTVRFRHDATIVFAAFLPGDKSVLSISEDGVVCAWEFPSGKEVKRVAALADSKAKVTSWSLSPDSKYLTIFCSDSTLRIVDWSHTKVLGQMAHGMVITPARPGFGKGPFKGGLPKMNRPTYSADSKTLMLPASARVLQFVDLAAGKQIGPIGHVEGLASIGFTQEGQRIFTKDPKSTRTWDAATGKDLGAATIKIPTGAWNVVLSPDGRVGMAISPASNQEPGAFLFDPMTGKELRKPIQFWWNTRSGLFSANGNTLAISRGDGTEKIDLYDVPSGKRLRSIDTGVPTPINKNNPKRQGGVGPGGGKRGKGIAGGASPTMLLSPDGKSIAFHAGPGADIAVFATATGQQIGAVSANEGFAGLRGVFSPDGRCLALEMNAPIRETLFEIATGKPRLTFGYETWLCRFAISPDSRLLAHTDPSGRVLVQDLVTRKQVAAFKGHTMTINALAFSPNGKTLVSASDDTTALIWDLTKIARPAPPAQALQAADLKAYWQDLADTNAAKAFAAMGAFATSPKDTVAWIKDHVKPVQPLDQKRVEKLIKDLNHNDYAVRTTASKELHKIGELLFPVLEKALADKSSPESRKRLEDVRSILTAGGLQGERLRAFRAIEVLELIGTNEAREVLQALADGAPGALVTASAQASLKR